MLIYYLIVIIFIYYGLKNFDKALPIWAACSIATHYGTCLKATPPAVSVTFALNIFFIILFIYRYKNKDFFKKFPLQNEFLLILFTYLLSTIFSQIPFGNTILGTIQLLVNDYIIIIVIWFTIRNIRQVRLLVKTLNIIILLASIYGIIAFIADQNPIIEFEMSLLPANLEKMTIANATVRGLKAQSFFLSPTNFGVYIALFWLVGVMIKSKYKVFYNFSTKYFIVLTILIIISTTLTKTRTSIFSFLVLALPFLFKKSFIQSKYSYPLFLALFCSIPIISTYISPYVVSIFDADSSQVAGSSLNMRLNQLSIIWNEFIRNPISGLGIGSMVLVKAKNYEIYGAESIWFWILLERGIIGLISYIWVFISIIKKLSTKTTKLYLFLATAYWIILQTMTTTIGVSIYWYFLTVIIIYKIDKTTLKSVQKTKLSNL